MNWAGWHWHVTLRWRDVGQYLERELTAEIDLQWRPDDNVMYVAHTAARLLGAPLRAVEGFNCNLVKP